MTGESKNSESRSKKPEAEKSKKDKWDKSGIIAKIIGTILIPFLIAYMTLEYNSSQNQIQQAKDSTAYQLKLLEICYNDIASKDSVRQNIAMGILKMTNRTIYGNIFNAIKSFSPETNLKLSDNIFYDTSLSQFIRTNANQNYFEVLNKFNILSPLDGDSIEIFTNIVGISPFTDREHYVMISVNDNKYCKDKLIVTENGTWNQKIKIGDVSTLKGTYFEITVLAIPNGTLITDCYKLPENIYSSNTIKLIRK
jgi:hypothetical protein